MAARDGSEGAAQGGQLGGLRQQFQARSAETERTAQARAQGQQGQGSGRPAEGLDRQQEAPPFLSHRRPPQFPQHRQERLHPHPHPQAPLRQQQIPVVVFRHRQGFAHRPQHLGERVGGGPSAQTTPQGGA